MLSKTSLFAIVLSLIVCTPCLAKIRLNPLFSDHCVLQQSEPVPIWGVGEPNARVIVQFGDQLHQTDANLKGEWMVKLLPLEASKKPRALIVEQGDEKVRVRDVLVGEVWICSGQSNMAMPLRASAEFKQFEQEMLSGALDELRLFRVPVAGADERQPRVKTTRWLKPSETSASSFSAVGFYFGRKLLGDLDVPIGMIQASNGGTNAHCWINSETYRLDPAAAVSRREWRVANQLAEARESSKARGAKGTGKNNRSDRVRGNASRQNSTRTTRSGSNAGDVKRPTAHYNAMIAPLQPYAIRGVIWYQGEANSRPPFCQQYCELLSALVEDWRTDWAKAAELASAGAGSAELESAVVAHKNFPFYIVQLPNFGGGHPQGWPIIREQMSEFWSTVENTGMVTSIDVGEAQDIHPSKKKPVGERLATLALAETYEQRVPYSAPVLRSFEVEGRTIKIDFILFGSSLKSLDGEPLRHFQVAGESKEFVDAVAKVEGNQVIVTIPEQIEHVASVRYAWTNNPEHPNLGNAEGWPASPFRTDRWEFEF